MYTLRINNYTTPQKPVLLKFEDYEAFIKKSNEILKGNPFIIESIDTQRSSKRSKDLFIMDMRSPKLNLNVSIYIDLENLENFFNIANLIKENMYISKFKQGFKFFLFFP